MSAEVICIGTELLLGDILNTNCQYLAQELANLGIPHYYQTVVGDNVSRIHQVIETAISRSSILIFTGGLGPTPDDLTTETIASFFDTPLIEDETIVKDIELYRMWRETAVPFLKSQGWGKDAIYSEMMRFRGIGESALAEKVNHLFESSNPTVAPYAGKGEVRLRVAAKASSEVEAQALIKPVVTEIKNIAGLNYFGSNEDTLASVVGKMLQDAKQTVSVAESCTGGDWGRC